MPSSISKNSKTFPTPKPKIILFFPSPLPYERNWHGVPLALLAISRQLARENYDIQIYSRYLQKEYLKNILKEGEGSLCLGISAMTGFQIFDGLKTAKAFKKKYPKIPIIWGGWHPSILPLETVKNKYVDIIVRGQGDVTFTQLVHTLQDQKDLENIKGLTFKRGKKIVSTPDREPTKLSLQPPLPYHLVDISRCTLNTEYGLKTIPYISSYGCPHRCAFCVEQIVNKRSWTAVPAKMIIKEWQALIKKYGVDSFAVYDSNFFVDEKRTRDLCCGIIKKKLAIKWGNANGRVGQLCRYQTKTWELMKKSGCTMILTGAESGSQNALDFISKDMNVNDIIKFTRLCKKYKIKILYSFLVGLPWSEDPLQNKIFVQEEYKSTLALIDQLLKICNRNRYTYYVFLPYPGAPLFTRALTLGYQAPHTLSGWSNYLMSPEDAFKSILRQRWISPKQSRMTAMLTQYIFGLLDRDTFPILKKRVSSPLGKLIFTLSYRPALLLVKIRWKLKYFGLPFDYWLFTQVHKYAGLI
ncbi:MAG: radical SAM protein [Patescibacteria group bacterium]